MHDERFLEVQLRNMSTKELIKYCDNYADNPLVRELNERLQRCLDFSHNQFKLIRETRT